MSCDVGEVTKRLENELCYDYNYELCSFSNLSVTSPTSQLILQLFRRFIYITAYSPTLVLVDLRHRSFSNPSFASPTSQSLHLIHLASQQSSFSNLSVTSPTSQLILQPFRSFTYITALSPTLPLLHIRHSSFSNLSFASPTSEALHLIHLASQQNSFSNLSVTSPTSQLVLQPFRHFTYVTAHSPLLHLRHIIVL